MDNVNIELRSEKVRNIIGQIPPRIIRVGATLFFIFFVLLSCVVYGYRFQYKIKVQAQLWQTNNKINYTLFVPSNLLKLVKDNDIIVFNLPNGNQFASFSSKVTLNNSSIIVNKSGFFNKVSGNMVSPPIQIIDTLNIEAFIIGDSVNFINWIMMK